MCWSGASHWSASRPALLPPTRSTRFIVRCWNRDLKQKFEGRATLKDLQSEGIIDASQDLNSREGPQANKTEIVTSEVVQSNAEATQLARSRLRVIAQQLVRATGRTVGVPDLRQGTKVQIKGLGR